MPYLGKSPQTGNYSKIDDISSGFDGSDATHAIASNGVAITPVRPEALIISINGVIQEPVTDYTVSGTDITFTTAPTSGDNFFGVAMGEKLDIGTPSDATITTAKLATTVFTGATDIGANIADADLFLLDDGAGGTIRKTAASRLKTYIGGSDPASADGDSLGTASAEWSDLYLADGGIIYFGNDQDITLTHAADTGLNLKHVATADDKPIVLTLQTGETDIAANDVLGKIAFQAPDEAQGTDAVLVAGAIQVVSEGDFSSSNNAVTMEFHTAASEAAATKAKLTSTGVFQVGAGAVGGPSLSFTGDPDTGMFSVGADELGIAVGGSRPIYSTNRKVCINDDATGNMASGLCINQTSYDDNIFELKSSDVAHGYTGVAETDTYFWIKKQAATGGGVSIAAANESGNVNALEFRVHNDTYSAGKSTGTNCGSTFFFFDGESGDIDANGNMLGISARRGGSNEIVFLVDEDGDIHNDGSVSAYDEYDDAMLARAMQIELSGQSRDNKEYGKMIKTEFDNFVKYNKRTLIDAGLLGQTTEEESQEGHRGLINVTGMQRLHNGAIVQQRAMFETLKSVAEEMLPGFAKKLNERLEAQSLPALPVY